MNAPTRTEFLQRRKAGLGGSDIGAILGLSKFKTPVEIWLEKTGRSEPADETLQMRFGIFAEEFVAQEYTRDTGRRVQRYNALLRHSDYPMVIGNPDRLVIPEGAKIASHRGEIRTDRGWEGKTASAFAASDAAEWGPAGTDNVPSSYHVQSCTYMALTKCATWDLSVMFGNQEVRHYTIRRDLDLEEELLRRAAEWWRNHVIADVAPEPQSEADVRLLYPQDNQQQIDADEDVYAAFARLVRAKEQIKALEADEQAARDVLTTYMGEAAVLRYQGATLATYKAARPSSKTDWKAIAKELGVPMELQARFTTETAGSRRLILK